MRAGVAVGLMMATVGLGCSKSPDADCVSCVAPAPDAAAAADEPSDLGADTTRAADLEPVPPPDAGAPCCPAGPWPLEDTTYGAAEGLDEPLLDASPDEAQNLWAASAGALYLLRPGETRFHKYTAADGLHIGPFTDWYKNPATTSITAMAGGDANEVFVGYFGFEGEGDPYLDTDEQKALGNADKVTVDASGKLTITRYLFKCDFEGANGCWEDRSPRRMVFAHSGVAKGHLFIGFNHGVTHVFQDQFGDHVHPEVFWQQANGTSVEKLGEFYGIAPDPDGNLWMAGRYGVGLQPWNPTPHLAWVSGHFIWAFTLFAPGHSLETPDKYTEKSSGVALTPDGRVWVSSFEHGLTVWDPSTKSYATIQQVSGVPAEIQDLAADPDGTLWLVPLDGTLRRFDPASGALTTWPGLTSRARRVVVDTTVTPRSVYVAMDAGLAVIRAK